MSSENQSLSFHNFYEALGDYEKSVRDRKYRIAVSEDKISSLKESLEEARKQNESLESKCQILRLEVEMEETRSQSDTHKKSKLKDQSTVLAAEKDEVCGALKDKNSLLQKLGKNRESRSSNLKKQELEFMARYYKIPLIESYVNLSSQLQHLETSLKEQHGGVADKLVILETRILESQGNWKDFVKLSIHIAKVKDDLQAKVNDYEDLNWRQEVEESSTMTKIKDDHVNLDKPFESPKISQHKNMPMTNTVSSTASKKIDSDSRLGNSMSTSLEQRLQRIRRSFSVTTAPKSSGHDRPGTASVGPGIKRYYDAVEQLNKSNGNLNSSKQISTSNYQSPPISMDFENSLEKSITEIHQRFSRQTLQASNAGSSVLRQQLLGYKTNYSSWLTDMVNSENPRDQESLAKRPKSDETCQENMELVKEPTKVSMDTESLDLVINNSESMDSDKSSPNLPVDKPKQTVYIDKPVLITPHVDKPKRTVRVDKPIPTTPHVDKSRISITGGGDMNSASQLVHNSKDSSGLFKVPPPPKNFSSPFGKDTPFIGDGTGNEFSLNSTTLDIFSNNLDDSGLGSGGSSPTSGPDDSHSLFDFDKFFGSTTTTITDKNSPLF